MRTASQFKVLLSGSRIRTLLASALTVLAASALSSAPAQSGGTAPQFDSPPTPPCGSTIDAFVGQQVCFTVQASDAEPGDEATLNSAGVPAGATLNPALPTSGNPVSTLFCWTPTAGDVGSHIVQFSATDQSGAQVLCEFDINVSRCNPNNRPPDFGGGGPIGIAAQCGTTYEASAGQPFSLDVSASDPDANDTVDLSMSTGPATASFISTSGNPANGTFSWTPTAADAGDNTVTFTASDGCAEANCSVTIHVASNQEPDCSSATASEGTLWPPNHTYHAISILGVTDPDGDPVTITVTSITQDEPVNGRGDGNTCPDGQIVDGQASVRAERTGTPGVPGNGRVYAINFTADDGNGGTCQGTVSVCVPHDQGAHSTCQDDGQRYNSLGPCTGGNGLQSEVVTSYSLQVGNVTSSRADLTFAVPADSKVLLAVYDVTGRRLATIENGSVSAGTYQRSWDLSAMPSGMYFVRLQAGEATLNRTVLKLQ